MFDHTRNEEIFKRASACLAGGVLSNFKKSKGSAPVYVKEAEGCHITDYDGNTYYDFSLSAGPAILGHSNQGIRQALKKELDQAYTNRDTLIAIEAAEKIKEIVPCAELVRFSVSGVDAVFNAIRVTVAWILFWVAEPKRRAFGPRTASIPGTFTPPCVTPRDVLRMRWTTAFWRSTTTWRG